MVYSRRFLSIPLAADLGTALIFLLALSMVGLMIAPDSQAQTVRIYVDADAAGDDDGTSWVHAYNHLQGALDQANANPGNEYEIWVAEGVYYPDEGAGRTNDDQNEFFRLNYNNVQLYGGFAGGETNRDQRNWTDNITVLSGDIDKNDTNTDGNQIAEDWTDVTGNNSFHVLWLDGVTNEPITSDTVIDGFIVTAGQANAAVINNHGGGMYCDGSGSGNECSPKLMNLIICGNQGATGGGLFNDADFSGAVSPTLTNVTFRGNLADIQGGGLYNFAANDSGSISNPVLTNVKFISNDAKMDGGGMYSIGAQGGTSNPVLTNVLFIGNRADSDGNNDGKGGGMSNYGSQGTCSPTMTNVTFSGNQAYLGGGMYNYSSVTTGVCSPSLINVILWDNSAAGGPQLFKGGNANPGFSYSDIQGSGGSGSWDLLLGTDNGNNIDSDPLFMDSAGGDLRLRPGSPAVNAGDVSALPLDTYDLDSDGDTAEAIPVDLAFKKRVQAGALDMGAYETPVSSVSAVSLLLLGQ